MPPVVDLVLVFNPAAAVTPFSKQQAIDDARAAEEEYARLLSTLRSAGFRVTGRSGERQGQILILLWTPPQKLADLVNAQLRDDFLLGLPSASLPGQVRDFTASPLSQADRRRVVYAYITSLKVEGGLGVTPGVREWPRLQNILTLHDTEFNKLWIHDWTQRVKGIHLPAAELTKIRNEFGEAVAMYFAFLSAYTQALFFPAVLGLLFWVFKSPYSPWYSALLTLWSLCWVEWWRIKERALAVRWGTLGSFRAEKRRAQYCPDQGEQPFPWWKREARILTSVPIIILFAVILGALLTAIFVFEAFVTQLYSGPLREYVSLTPTLLLVTLIPRVLEVYQAFARRLTNWENHSHQSTHDASLTIKTFALSAVVAYLGLALSAFIYVPFGPFLMYRVHEYIHTTRFASSEKKLFAADILPHAKLDASRLQNQMFAYTVTSQIVNTLVEVVLPYVLRGVNDVRNGKHHNGNGNGNGNGKKKVGFEDQTVDDKAERQFLTEVRRNVALPDYELFGDYAEMVTQFGYVSLWSTIWPLAPLMALLNNWLELRSDAFKMVTHSRRPLPFRVDTIGPWLESMAFISWFSSFTNAALVSLFRPQLNKSSSAHFGTALHTSDITLTPGETWHALLQPALLLALSTSYGFILGRGAIRRLMDKALWRDSQEERTLKHSKDEVAGAYLKNVVREEKMSEEAIAQMGQGAQDGAVSEDTFWMHDEGLEELRRAVKEA